jgi:hypothetical protein
MKKAPYVLSIAVSLFLATAVSAPSFGQTPYSSSTPANGISSEFGSFLTNVDSHQVVNDLRNGQWSTTVIDPATNTPTTTVEALPSGSTGWGNVRLSLALAQHSLNQQGITQPTQEELYGALAGDTTNKGILQMRSEGMGWGEIAKHYDTTVGKLMSGIKAGKQPVSTTTTTTATTSATTSSKRIVTGRGKSETQGAVSTTAKGNGKSFAGTKSQGSGIVSASGQSSGASSSFVSHGSRGIVSGSGRALGHTSGIVTGAGGNGHGYGASGDSVGKGGGHGKGHNK